MASSVVGILKVLLTADTAGYERAMKDAASAANVWSKDLGSIGRQATQVGSALTRTLTLPLVGLGVGAVKLAADFESSFAGVRKTVEATEPEFAALAQGLRNMSKEIPVNVNELNRVAEAAGQMGIKKDDIIAFTRTMADLGVTTNLTADEAATATAQIQNIFGTAGKDVDRFGATLVALGNAGASTEKDIIEMGKRIAGAGNQVGLSQAQVLGFASALSSVGINAEAGGSAISRVFLKINDAVAKGGKGMAEFARVAGMTGAQFKQAWEQDAATATTAFISGLARLKAEGENVNQTLEGLVGKNIIIKDTLMRASGAGNLLTEQLALANKAWQENTALTKEAEERYKTFASQLTVLWNQIKDVGITLGTSLLPTLKDLIVVATPMVGVIAQAAQMFAAMPEPVRLTIVGLAGVVAAIGPLLWAFGQLITAAGTVIGAFTAKGIAMRALTAVGPPLVAAMGAVASSFVAIGALAVGLVASLAAVGKAFVDLYNHWKSGKSMWDFFTAKDDDNFVRRWLGLSKAVRDTDIALSGAADSAAEFVGPLQQSTVAAARLTAGVTELSKAEKKRAADAMDALKKLNALEGDIVKENAAFRAEAIRGIDAEAKAWRNYYNELGMRRMEDDAERMKPLVSTLDLSKMFEPFKTFNLKKTFAGISDAFKNLGPTIISALQGGGSVVKSVGSLLGQGIGTDLVKNFGKTITATLGSTLGGAVNAVLPGVGALLGPLLGVLGKGFKNLFGIGVNDEVRKFNTEIDKVRANLLSQFGSMERIRKLGIAVGIDLAGAWKHQGEAGLKAFQDMAKAFEEAVAKMESDLEGFQQDLDNAINDARDMGYIFDREGKLVSVRFESMRDAANEFGINLDALGSEFHGQRIAADAKKIVDTFELLTKGGASEGTVLHGMREEISKVVQEAMKFGTVLPEQMKPFIIELARTDQLLDENGNAIKDISQLKLVRRSRRSSKPSAKRSVRSSTGSAN